MCKADYSAEFMVIAGCSTGAKFRSFMLTMSAEVKTWPGRVLTKHLTKPDLVRMIKEGIKERNPNVEIITVAAYQEPCVPSRVLGCGRHHFHVIIRLGSRDTIAPKALVNSLKQDGLWLYASGSDCIAPTCFHPNILSRSYFPLPQLLFFEFFKIHFFFCYHHQFLNQQLYFLQKNE